MDEIKHDLEVEDLVDLADFIRQFAWIDRAIYFDKNKTSESDTDHTVMLAVFACSIASRFLSELDVGKVAQYAIVHDLVEVYAGDVSTMNFKKVDVRSKENAEKLALEKIKQRFGKKFPWIHKQIEQYESLNDPEARFVKTLDKLLPGITHMFSEGMMIDEEFETLEDFIESVELRNAYMKSSFAKDQPLALDLRKKVLEKVIEEKRNRDKR